MFKKCIRNAWITIQAILIILGIVATIYAGIILGVVIAVCLGIFIIYFLIKSYKEYLDKLDED